MLLPKELPKNPLPAIVKIVGTEWTDPMKMALVIGFQFKLVGLDYRTDNELTAMLSELGRLGFLIGKPDGNSMLVRVNPCYAESAACT